MTRPKRASKYSEFRPGLKVLFQFAWESYIDKTTVVRNSDKKKSIKNFFSYTEDNWSQILEVAKESPLLSDEVKCLLPSAWVHKAYDSFKRSAEFKEFELVRFYRPFVGQVRDTANTIEILIFVTILQTLGPQYAKESEKYKPKERTSDPMLNIVGSGKENLNPNLPIEETIKVKVEPNSSSNNLSVPEGTSKLSTSSNASVTEGRPLKIKIRLDPSKRSRDSAGSATDLQQQQQQQQHLQHQQIQPVVKPAPVRTAWQQTQQVPSSFIPNTKQGTIPKMIIPITSSPAQPTFSPVSSSCASSNFATTPTTASYATSTATSTPRSIMSNLKDRSIPSEKKKVNFPRNNSDLVKVKVEEDDSLVKQMNKMGISESEDMDNDIELVSIKRPSKRYVLDEVLDVGGQGIAIRAHVNNTEKRKVVVKIPYGSNKSRVLNTESMVSSRVKSRYVLNLMDTIVVSNDEVLAIKPSSKKYLAPGETSNALVYEFMNFRSLADFLLDNERIPVWNCHIIALEQALALNACHESSILHRDFKTDNVFIRDDLVLDRSADPKILYKRFLVGLAYTCLGDPGLATTIRGRMTKQVGTSGQIAPEMYSQTRYGAEVDVFAYCVTLVELYTGRPVYPMSLGDDEVDDLVKSGETSVRCEKQLREVALDEGTKRMVLRGLAVDPEDRPPMTEFIHYFRDRLDFVVSALNWK